MREDRPSTTASAVAFARAVASLPVRRAAPSPDLVAKHMLRPALGALVSGLEILSPRAPGLDLALRALSLGLVDHMALRTAAIDGVLERLDVRQLVILGAGLDSRAYRLASLSRATVFEVDHPATQRFKRARVRDLPVVAGEVRFVSVDFEREGIDVRLEEEGHDASAPTVWIWEGVVPYLDPSATRATLARIAARSAPGSVLAVTYVTKDRLWLERFKQPVKVAFEILGEPLRGVTTREDFRALLEEHGFRVTEDTSPHDWKSRYGWALSPLLTILERLAVAER
jgi:methyltransferase (TIGR00027 family)